MNEINSFQHELKERLFMMNFSDLQERLDPAFYIALDRIKQDIEEKAKYEYVNLIKACSIKRGRFGHRPRNDPKFYGGNYPFIQTGDIVKATETNQSIEYTQTLNELGLKTSKLFNPPKLVFTIAANIGETAILDYPACFPDSIVALIPRDNTISIEYLNIYLKLIKKYIVELAPYSAQRNLNNQQLAKVPIIVPPNQIQSIIVSKMNLAYETKAKKLHQAKNFLASINDYLLKELNFNIPSKNNSLKNRIFLTNFSEIHGNRIDPFYNERYYLDLDKKLNVFPKLGSLINNITKGETPLWRGDSYVQEGVPFLQVNNLDISGVKTNYKKIPLEVHKRMKRSILKGGEILYTMAGSIGLTVINNLEEEANINQAIAKIEVDSPNINKIYLTEILNSKISKVQSDRLLTVAAQPNINFEQIKSIRIPLPHITKQDEIANHIQTIRNKAKDLRQEANQALKSAKQQIEQLILNTK